MAMTEKTTKKIVAKAKSVKPAAKKVEPKAKSDRPASKDSGRFAVIATGGKQYVVFEGKTYDFEKLEAEEGKTVEFSEVLLIADGGDVKIGQPHVAGAKVSGKVLKQFKDDKVLVLKYKPKKRYRKTQGHRQQKTKVEITKIS